jgi:hypothetical protein
MPTINGYASNMSFGGGNIRVFAISQSDCQHVSNASGQFSITVNNNTPHYLFVINDNFGKKVQNDTLYAANSKIRPYQENGHYYSVVSSSNSRTVRDSVSLDAWPTDGTSVNLLTDAYVDFQKNTTYSIGDVFKAIPDNGHYYTVTKNGVKSGNATPIFPTDGSTYTNNIQNFPDLLPNTVYQVGQTFKFDTHYYTVTVAGVSPTDLPLALPTNGMLYELVANELTVIDSGVIPSFEFIDSGTINAFIVQDLGYVEPVMAHGPIVPQGSGPTYTLSGETRDLNNNLVARSIYVIEQANIPGTTLNGNNYFTLTGLTANINYYVVCLMIYTNNRWQPNKSYSYLEATRPTTDNGYWYETNKSGVSASSEPSFTINGSTFVENEDIIWVSRCPIQRPAIAGPYEPY